MQAVINLELNASELQTLLPNETTTKRCVSGADFPDSFTMEMNVFFCVSLCNVNFNCLMKE